MYVFLAFVSIFSIFSFVFAFLFKICKKNILCLLIIFDCICLQCMNIEYIVIELDILYMFNSLYLLGNIIQGNVIDSAYITLNMGILQHGCCLGMASMVTRLVVKSARLGG